MTMTLYIDRAGTLTTGAPHADDHLQVIRALLDFASMLLRGAVAPSVSGGAHETSLVDDDDAITWEDAEWQ
jgi:hypothetical protein